GAPSPVSPAPGEPPASPEPPAAAAVAPAAAAPAPLDATTPAATTAEGASDSEPPPDDEVVVLVDRIRRAPGSVHVIGQEALERYKYDDPHAALQLVPGVYVRQEDGLGLRPNIGIRGAISDRSSKVALME